ncbi:hypothetical protein CDCA_CDCA14G3746 [Cyanidium caldarium]|uniref:TBC1 domain family member 23 n=1 Tax=Cyanidium caldarium TaxID=2771 RepID=A0AAV9J004_CYACA|nr:hypothetical protein CDCA_CDCA14G3746 [Cyanidium caldarium]
MGFVEQECSPETLSDAKVVEVQSILDTVEASRSDATGGRRERPSGSALRQRLQEAVVEVTGGIVPHRLRRRIWHELLQCPAPTYERDAGMAGETVPTGVSDESMLLALDVAGARGSEYDAVQDAPVENENNNAGSANATVNHTAEVEALQPDLEETYEIIERDAERTRRGLQAFEDERTRQQLCRWLRVFCASRRVPYIQGLNEVAAVFLLLPAPEADAGADSRYDMFAAFVEAYLPFALQEVSQPFVKLKQVFRAYARLLAYHDPELAAHLTRHSLTPDMYTTSWFVTLFAHNFVVEAVLALWDALLLDGDPVRVVFFALVMLVSNRQSVLMANEARLPELLMQLALRTRTEVQAAWQWADKLMRRTPRSFTEALRQEVFGEGSPEARSLLAGWCLQMDAREALSRYTPPSAGRLDGRLSIAIPPCCLVDCRARQERACGRVAGAVEVDLEALRDARMRQSLGGAPPAPEQPLEAGLSAEARAELRTAEERLQQAVADRLIVCVLGSGGGGGGGDDEDTELALNEEALDVYPLVQWLLERGVPYVCVLAGGFAALAALDNSSLEYDAERLLQARRRKVLLAQQLRGTAATAHANNNRAAIVDRPEWKIDRVLLTALGWRNTRTSDASLARAPPDEWMQRDRLRLAKDTGVDLASPLTLRRLQLYPCLKFQRKSNAFVKRYLGVTRRALFVLAPDRARNTVFRIKSGRALLQLRRIVFRKERRDLVVFEFRAASSPAVDKKIVCCMPDGLDECVGQIRAYLVALKSQLRAQRAAASAGKRAMEGNRG